MQKSKIRELFNKVFEAGLDLVFPPTCTGCGTEGHWVCRQCFLSAKRYSNAYCPQCSRPSVRGSFCLSCHQKSHLSQIFAACSYSDYRVSRMVRSLKFQYVTKSVSALIPFLTEVWKLYGSTQEVVCVVPIPLHVRRFRERGFNQADLLARGFAEAFHFPYMPAALQRNQYTVPQTSLARDERIANIKKIFTASSTVKNQNILLIDDVFTTGATLQDAARTLREQGAADVKALTLAHG